LSSIGLSETSSADLCPSGLATYFSSIDDELGHFWKFALGDNKFVAWRTN
jgi:hypothetical protein